MSQKRSQPRSQPHSLSFRLAALSTIFFAVTLTSTGSQAESIKGRILASSNATDPSARQIVRSVANESLKTISTKDAASPDEPATTAEHLDDVAEHITDTAGPVVMPAKIASHAAPGAADMSRAPAAKDDDSEPSKDAKAAAPAAHAAVKTDVAAEKALLWLQNGNKRFLKAQNRTDGKAQPDRERLSKGQHPHAIVLSCADSRVPPETVFDQSLGEIFVVRTAGEALDNAVIASLEYAVEHLGPRLLVVMGHTSCGAVQATISTNEGSSAGSPALDAMIADIRPHLPSRGPAGAASHGLEIESSANAQGVAADLIKRSAIIRARVEKGDLLIKPALYYLDSGVVKFY